VVVFAYDRLYHLNQTINALKNNTLAKFTNLIIYSDGPKTQDKSQEIQCVRNYIDSIDGFASITIYKSKINLGLTNSIVLGVTETVNKYGKVIVIEDDIVTSTSFLDFMNNALNYYKDDNHVMQISGYFPFHSNVFLPDTFFLNHISSWGWATWSRAWKNFHLQGQEYIDKFTKEDINKFNINGKIDRFQLIVDYESGIEKSWDIYWDFFVYCKKGLVLYSKHNKVINIGFDNTGVHCTSVKVPQYIDNNHQIANFTNIFTVNNYALFCYSKLQDKYFYNNSILKKIFKFVLIKIFKLKKKSVNEFVKNIKLLLNKIAI
jgi:hypothetical protein